MHRIRFGDATVGSRLLEGFHLLSVLFVESIGRYRANKGVFHVSPPLVVLGILPLAIV